MASDKPGFFAELKRRNVLRAAALYAGAAWAFGQGLSQFSPVLGLPDYATRWFLIAAVIGFPFWVAFAWFYEFTPQGIKRESEVAPSASITHSTARKLDFAIIGVLIVAVALLASGYVVRRKMPASAISAKSIAVLPFENLSNDMNNEYFVAGMQDLILTKLADIGDLKVISRTSTMQYKSHPGDLKTVGQQLGVATILEGSVQKQGNEVLINVQLINARTDSHIWAESYTRTLDNVFGVEGEVAGKIAGALDAKLSPAQAAQLAAAPSDNQSAMDLFLRAEYQANKGDINYKVDDMSGWRAAIPLYRQAIKEDPGFALAYARVSYVESILAYISGEDVAALTRQARADAEAAQRFAPHAMATLLALGYCDYYGNGDFTAALKTFGSALALRPNDSAALRAQGYVERKQNHYAAALASLEKAFTLDPRNSALAFGIGATHMMVSRFPEAGTWFERALALDPNNANAKSFYPYAILYGNGDVARALAAAQGDDPAMQLVRVTFLTYQRKYPEALALLEAIPDTPDNFTIVTGGSKALEQADLYRLLGDAARARPLYQQALADLHPQLAKEEQEQGGSYLAQVWTSIADAQLGLGETKEALAAIASAQAVNAKLKELRPRGYASVMQFNAALYSQAHRPDLAVPLLARSLTLPGVGLSYSPVLLWLDPAWDPIRNDPRFKALLQKYAKDKPAVIYPILPASAASVATRIERVPPSGRGTGGDESTNARRAR
ncbi:MAG TPA: tetratricopeptide repeat protein [Rhodanobacteraceae bacterium]|nr:tetratricopeptide repeat protein [Rhodanobacteraceae bacterium]